VLRVNIAKPLKAKLGHAKPVWAHDEWFKESLGDDRELADAEEVRTGLLL
jgi:hypothetical protein